MFWLLVHGYMLHLAHSMSALLLSMFRHLYRFARQPQKLDKSGFSEDRSGFGEDRPGRNEDRLGLQVDKA